jgi:hypothetical protein
MGFKTFAGLCPAGAGVTFAGGGKGFEDSEEFIPVRWGGLHLKEKTDDGVVGRHEDAVPRAGEFDSKRRRRAKRVKNPRTRLKSCLEPGSTRSCGDRR